jgi:hypothetical protein
MKSIYELMVKTSKFIDVGERNIVMVTRNYGRGKPRLSINLPIERNDLWQWLWERKIKVRVFIEIPEEELGKLGEEESVEKFKGRAQK